MFTTAFTKNIKYCINREAVLKTNILTEGSITESLEYESKSTLGIRRKIYYT